MKRALACIIILLTTFSCTKVEVDCTYTVRVYVLERQGGERIPAEDVKVYAFAVNPAEWTVANLDDARRGVITSIEGGETLDTPEVATKIFDTEGGETIFNGKNRFATPFTQQNMMLVVAHDTHDIFAYGSANLQYNLDRMEVTLVFELYRTDTEPYMQGAWEIHNEGTIVPVNCAYTVSAMQKRVENATTTVALNSTRLRVFYLSEEDGDLSDWVISSYQDALDGILTNKNNTADRKNAAEAEVTYSANNAAATITDARAVLAVYDTIQPMYGYAVANLQNNPLTQSDKVTFTPCKPNTTEAATTTDRWTVVMGSTYVSTLLTVSPQHKLTDSKAKPLVTTKGYAFYANSEAWDILSYEDALAGKITAKEGGAVREADITGVVTKEGQRIGFEMVQAEGHDKVIVVICDTVQPMYAITQIEPGSSNLKWAETAQKTVVFTPDKPDQTITSGDWEIRNGATTI